LDDVGHNKIISNLSFFKRSFHQKLEYYES